MKLRIAAFGMIAFLGMVSGGGCDAKPDLPPGSGGSGGGPPPNICAEGRSCNLNREFCCDGKAILQCTGGKYVQHDLCSGGVDECVDGKSSCGCNPESSVVCLNSTTVQACILGDSGDTFVYTEQCQQGQVCNPPCVDPVDTCVVGEIKCDLDGDKVARCERVAALGSCTAN